MRILFQLAEQSTRQREKRRTARVCAPGANKEIYLKIDINYNLERQKERNTIQNGSSLGNLFHIILIHNGENAETKKSGRKKRNLEHNKSKSAAFCRCDIPEK